jgi:hypothetical protein
MRRLTPAVMMMAVNHKGKVIYSNTQLATLLGYKLKMLRCAPLPTHSNNHDPSRPRSRSPANSPPAR